MPGPEGISRSRDGALSAEEFARRFEAAGRLLWTIAAGVLGAREEVDDVLQEACVLALGKLETYERDAHFTAWMGRFVRNTALNHARKRQRRATYPMGPEEMLELSGSGHGVNGSSTGFGSRAGARADGPQGKPVDALVDHGAEPEHPVDARGRLRPDQGHFDDRMLEALQALGENQRAALLLRTTHSLSYREISDVLEIPEGTAMSHVHRAQKALREALFGDAAAQTTDQPASERGGTH